MGEEHEIEQHYNPPVTCPVEQDLKELAAMACQAIDYISIQKGSMEFDEQGNLTSRVVDGNLAAIKDKIQNKFNVKTGAISEKGGQFVLDKGDYTKKIKFT